MLSHNGLNAVLVEDDALIPSDLRKSLKHAGTSGVSAQCINKVAPLSKAPLDAAILDVRLGDSVVIRLAEKLQSCQAPNIFLSLVDDIDDMRRRFPHATALSKPLRKATLLDNANRTAKGLDQYGR